MTKVLISTSEIARKYNIPSSTINHYTIIGLLPVVGRKRNMRLYDEFQLKQRLAKIQELRSKGYPLHLIQQELNKS